jgi:CheY-like chemotaxis protein
MSKPDPPATPRVLSVGQCGFDHRSIAGCLADRFGAEVEHSDSLDETRDAMRSARYDLVLVNRVLDDDGTSGLELIQALKDDPDPALADVPVMLVSNHADAQQAALDLGALPGFGKADLHSDATLERINALLGE